MAVVLSISFKLKEDSSIKLRGSVYKVLKSLGINSYQHEVDLSKSSASLAELEKIGEDLIHKGRAHSPEGKMSSRISKYYVCTSCHNTEREDPDLSKVDQEARLSYAIKNNIPYLQGSTFWGIVNRKSWYNDDYIVKYGSLVEPARTSLRESIKLCAVECSQGRELKDLEIEAILSYLWKLEYKTSDLNISDLDLDLISNAINNDENVLAAELIKNKYLSKSPATFIEVPSDKSLGYGYKGRIEKGKHIYELSCLHCHRKNGESKMILDNSKKVLKNFERNIVKESLFSLYDIVRHGTHAVPGHRAYMPLYTEEKMSKQQLEDLRSYILAETD